MLLSKATDSLFSGGGWGLATNVVHLKNAIVVVQWGVRGTLVLIFFNFLYTG